MIFVGDNTKIVTHFTENVTDNTATMTHFVWPVNPTIKNVSQVTKYVTRLTFDVSPVAQAGGGVGGGVGGVFRFPCAA